MTKNPVMTLRARLRHLLDHPVIAIAAGLLTAAGAVSLGAILGFLVAISL